MRERTRLQSRQTDVFRLFGGSSALCFLRRKLNRHQRESFPRIQHAVLTVFLKRSADFLTQFFGKLGTQRQTTQTKIGNLLPRALRFTPLCLAIMQMRSAAGFKQIPHGIKHSVVVPGLTGIGYVKGKFHPAMLSVDEIFHKYPLGGATDQFLQILQRIYCRRQARHRHVKGVFQAQRVYIRLRPIKNRKPAVGAIFRQRALSGTLNHPF